MILWRVSNYQNLDGVGGLYVSGRWHTKGHQVIYCAANPAAALLETLIHIEIDSEDRPEHFQVLRIEGPDTLSQETVKADALPANWTEDFAVSQAVGNGWLSEERSVLLHVPSVLVPETSNILINPRHPRAHLLKITMTYEHPFDSRFFQ